MTARVAPIALFAYRRRAHLAATVAALRANESARHSLLHVFCDGPRDAEDAAGTQEVRDLVRRIDGFQQVKIHESPVHLGLSRAILAGVSHVLEHHEQVIVMEDDLVCSPFFLDYMNSALSCYRDDPRVGSIQGYLYPGTNALPETFFMLGGGSWGWATWRRAWATFERDGNRLLDALEQSGRLDEFELGGAAPYTRHLRMTIAGMLDSWAARWHASCFLNDLHALLPGRSLIRNIGMDGSGRHCPRTDAFEVPLSDRPIRVEPVVVEQNAAAVERYAAHFLARNWARPARAPGRLSALALSALALSALPRSVGALVRRAAAAWGRRGE